MQATQTPSAPVIDPQSEAKLQRAREAIFALIREKRPRFVAAFEQMQFIGNTICVSVPTAALREEMLRMQLKRFIIICTRIAREHFSVGADREKLFDTVRRYYVLVDEHFRTKKRVQDYAGLLHRSPKTLANLFASCGQPSPLNIIHDRVNAEARRLLLYTPKSAKEIAYLLGYEDTAAFSRFFAKMNGESITGFRQREKRE